MYFNRYRDAMLANNVGVVIEDADPDKFSEAVAALINDGEVREKMGIRAREKAIAEFGLSKMIAEYASFYQALISRNRGLG